MIFPKRKIHGLGCAVLALISFLPSAVRAEVLRLTLEDAMMLSMQANYDVKVAKERLARFEAMVGEARSAALPQLTGYANYQKNMVLQQIFIQDQKFQLGFKNEYTAGANFSQAIYSAGKVLKALKAAEQEKMSAEAALKDTREEIKLQVKRTFSQILLVDRIIEIKKKTLKQLGEQRDAIQKRYDNGIDSDYTLMRQEVQYSNVQPELSAAQQQRIVLVNALKDLLGLPYQQEVDIVGQLSFSGRDIAKEDDLVAEALSKRKDIQAKDHHVEALRKLVGIESGGYLPTLNFTSGIMWQGQSNAFRVGTDNKYYTANIGLNLSVPIFDGLKTHYRIKEAESDLKIATEEEHKLRSNVASQVKNIKALYDEAVVREKSQKKALELAQKAVDIASLRFSQGLTSQLELNDTILQRDQAEQLYAQALFDCVNAEATLVRAIGGEL